jgi:hypothetical protein
VLTYRSPASAGLPARGPGVRIPDHPATAYFSRFGVLSNWIPVAGGLSARSGFGHLLGVDQDPIHPGRGRNRYRYRASGTRWPQSVRTFRPCRRVLAPTHGPLGTVTRAWSPAGPVRSARGRGRGRNRASGTRWPQSVRAFRPCRPERRNPGLHSVAPLGHPGRQARRTTGGHTTPGLWGSTEGVRDPIASVPGPSTQLPDESESLLFPYRRRTVLNRFGHPLTTAGAATRLSPSG